MTVQTRPNHLLSHGAVKFSITPTNVLHTYAVQVRAGRVRYRTVLSESQLRNLVNVANGALRG